MKKVTKTKVISDAPRSLSHRNRSSIHPACYCLPCDGIDCYHYAKE